MATRLFALISGILYLLFGLLGWCPWVQWTPDMPRDRMYDIHFGPGWIFGALPVNWPHNILWILFGLAGIACCLSFFASRAYARIMFVITVPLTFLGFLPAGISFLWGFLPLSYWNVIVHAWTAMTAWYFGWIYPLGLRQKITAVPAH